jgi:hypothetical protein
MQVGIVVGFGLWIGIAFLSGCAPGAGEVKAQLASAPTRLLPEAYAAPSAPAGSTASPAAEAPLAPAPAALSVAGRAVQSPAIKPHQYHPNWVVDVH